MWPSTLPFNPHALKMMLNHPAHIPNSSVLI